MTRYKIFILIFLLPACWCGGEVDLRPNTLEAAKRAGFGKWLNAPVGVKLTPVGIVEVHDEGVYFFQYDLETPQTSSEPNVVIDASVLLPKTADKGVFITHGWIDKGEKKWPQMMAQAIRQKTEPNEWICGFFDWSGGSGVITSIQAAQYARDIGGPRLAAAILKMPATLDHLHLIGHSAGSWVISTAAKRISRERPGINLHLTFLDAYVPQNWDPNDLGCLDSSYTGDVWAEQYYTRDITYVVTQNDLNCAHNVDITAIDPIVAEHEFPYRWYLATITGSFDRWDEKGQEVIKDYGGMEYGFARSLEASQENWMKSKNLPCGNTAVKFEKSK